jgi:ubiquinone/menaquinone biosynthesis C-methylase UbiE
MSYKVFERFSEHYDAWYFRHPEILESEIRAIKALRLSGLGLDVGVGTGIFAHYVRANVGIDASCKMLRIAKKRGIQVIQALAELLPFPDETFDYALMIVTLCFLDNPKVVLKEVFRVLKHEGILGICIIRKDSPWGQFYIKKAKRGHRFYRYAHFYSLSELEELLKEHHFNVRQYKSTLTYSPSATPVVENPNKDPRIGSFVCIKAIKE